jgi:hypothetical protein
VGLLEGGQRGTFIRRDPDSPRLQKEQLEGLAQDCGRRRERLIARQVVAGLQPEARAGCQPWHTHLIARQGIARFLRTGFDRRRIRLIRVREADPKGSSI